MTTSRPRRGDRPVMYGRDRERAQLHQLLNGTIADHGALVLISGEAGIGKTTLVDNLIHEATQRDCIVLAGGCYDLTTTPPYGPWSEALRDYRPEGDLPSGPTWFGNPDELEKIGSQTALFEEARRFFAAVAGVRPLVIVLEDLHWADSATLEALRYLARSLSAEATLLLATYREDEVNRRHELYTFLPTVVRESRPQRIHLNRLARHDLWELVTGRYNLETAENERLVMHLSARSQGNPFFAEEILQGLENNQVLQPVAGGWELGDLDQTPVPTLLRQAIELRFSRLSTETRAALRAAAVIGQVVPLDLWQSLSTLDGEHFERVVREALEAYVLQESATGELLQFRHALLREALYDALTPIQRHFKHRIVGEMLAEIPNTDPSAVAHHFRAAGDRRAAHWLIRAGVRAEGSFAFQLAANQHDTAQEILAADSDAAQARGWLLFHIGHLLRYSDEERSIAYLEHATQIARHIDDPVLEAQSQHVQGLLHCFQGEVGRGLAKMKNTLTIMDAITAAQKQCAQQAVASLFPSEVFSNPSAASGGSFFHSGRPTGVNTLTQTYVMWLALAGRFQEATDLGEAFIDQVSTATADTLLIQDTCRDAYYGLSFAADWLGRPDGARRWRTLALGAYEAIGHRALVTAVRGEELLHLLTYQTDRLAERRRCAQATTVPIEGIAEHQLGRGSNILLDLIEGRWDKASKFARQIIEEQDPYARYYRLWIHKIVGREQGDERLATAVQADIHSVLPQGPTTDMGQKRAKNIIIAHQLAAELALDAGDRTSAHEWITAHDHWIDWSESVLGRADAQLLWTRFHRTGGDLDRARQYADQALENATDPRQPLALIAARRALGQLDIETGHYPVAREHLRASLELAERCEAPYERALTMFALAELAACSDDVDEAMRLTGAVRALCEPLGAERTLARVAELETKLQEQPHAATTPFGLTPRELEVLQAVAEGLTDAEAGERLYISTRTVSHHLRSIYSKLEINNRAAAVRIAVERELV